MDGTLLTRSAPLICDRIAAVQQRIVEACRRSGRSEEEVSLVAVSKLQPIECLREAISCGLKTFGESRVQEALNKIRELPADLDWHLIGPLQSNKVKPAAELFSTIHSLDRLKIAHLLAKEAGKRGTRIRAFVQVHLGPEPSKHGFPEHDLVPAVRPLADLDGLEILGLMAIPPFEEAPERARCWFRRLRELRDLLAEQPEWQDYAGYLSMGMSHDFEIAIEEGATHIRVGTLLFGEWQGGRSARS